MMRESGDLQVAVCEHTEEYCVGKAIEIGAPDVRDTDTLAGMG